MRKRKSTVINDENCDIFNNKGVNNEDDKNKLNSSYDNNNDNYLNDQNENNDDEAITISEEMITELKKGFTEIANTRLEFLKSYKDRLNFMQDCIINAGFNYQQAIDANNLFLIWRNVQSYKSFQNYILEHIDDPKSKNNECTKVYL